MASKSEKHAKNFYHYEKYRERERGGEKKEREKLEELTKYFI